jgi:hypothetical protein
MERVLGAKGLWRHVVGTAVAPKPYAMVDGVPVLVDGKTPATEEQIEYKEDQLTEFEKKEYLAQHLILSTTSTRLGGKIKNLMSAKEMWDVVEVDATSKSTLFILDAEGQLSSMKLQEDEDPETHLMEMNEHFQVMVQRHENLTKMGSEISDARFNTLIMSSLPESYRPALQTITAAERASALTNVDGSAPRKMKPSELIAFLVEEAHHRVINDGRSRKAEQALAAHGKSKAIEKGKGKEKPKAEDEATSVDSEIICHNCGKAGHKKHDCYSEGGGKEGQALWQKKGKKNGKRVDNATVADAESEDNGFFAFTCTSDSANVAEATQVPRLRLGVYTEGERLAKRKWSIDRDVTTHNGRRLKLVGTEDPEIGSKTVEGDTVHGETESQYSDDTAGIPHGALFEGEMESDCFIQYPERSVEKSQIESELVVDGEIGGYSSCYQEYPLEFAAVKQAMDDSRTTQVPGVRITKGTAIDSRCIEYSRHVKGHGWKSACRSKPKLEELDWQARKKSVVSDESKAASRRMENGRQESKRSRWNRSRLRARSCQKGAGKLEDSKTKVVNEPKPIHKRRKRSTKSPKCWCKHLEPDVSVAMRKMSIAEGQKLQGGNRATEKPVALGTSRMQTQEVVRGQCIKYKGPRNDIKGARTLEGDGKMIGNKKAIKTVPVQQRKRHSPPKSSVSRPVQEGLSKGERVDEGIPAESVEEGPSVDASNAIEHGEVNPPVDVSNTVDEGLKDMQVEDQRSEKDRGCPTKSVDRSFEYKSRDVPEVHEPSAEDGVPGGCRGSEEDKGSTRSLEPRMTRSLVHTNENGRREV